MTPEDRAVLALDGFCICSKRGGGAQTPHRMLVDLIATAIRAAEDDALERAARECEAYDAERMAEDIRALKHKAQP